MDPRILQRSLLGRWTQQIHIFFHSHSFSQITFILINYLVAPLTLYPLPWSIPKEISEPFSIKFQEKCKIHTEIDCINQNCQFSSSCYFSYSKTFGLHIHSKPVSKNNLFSRPICLQNGYPLVKRKSFLAYIITY